VIDCEVDDGVFFDIFRNIFFEDRNEVNERILAVRMKEVMLEIGNIEWCIHR